jgi:hypothetical protein
MESMDLHKNGQFRQFFAATAAALFCMVAVGGSLPAAHAALNDSGAAEFSDDDGHDPSVGAKTAYPGQDAGFGRDAASRNGALKKTGGGSNGFDFTKLDAAGNPLPDSSKQWVCVRDNVTGLIWEVKTADGGLRDWRNYYSWYNPDASTNGGNSGLKNGGICSGGIECDTYAYTRAVNATKLCGHDDWRMPERWELRSLVDYGKMSVRRVDGTRKKLKDLSEKDSRLACIDSDYFPHTPMSWFWTATPEARDPESAWRVVFSDGGDRNGAKHDVGVSDAWPGIFLVRSGQ